MQILFTSLLHQSSTVIYLKATSFLLQFIESNSILGSLLIQKEALL